MFVYMTYMGHIGEDDNGCHLEVYPRASNEVYMCGIGNCSSSSFTPPLINVFSCV